jgi:hypothetical protein
MLPEVVCALHRGPREKPASNTTNVHTVPALKNLICHLQKNAVQSFIEWIRFGLAVPERAEQMVLRYVNSCIQAFS